MWNATEDAEEDGQDAEASGYDDDDADEDDSAESLAAMDEALTALEQARMLVRSAEGKVSPFLLYSHCNQRHLGHSGNLTALCSTCAATVYV